MALMHSTPGGSTYPDAETLEAEPDDISEAMRAHALSEDARHREMVDGFREGLEHVNLRVDDVEAVMGGLSTLAGVNPGSPTDASVTALIRNTGTTTRQALDGRYATTAALDALAESLDDLGPVHVSHFGAAGDGVADDTAALKAAAASGREVHFDAGAVYAFRGPVTLAAGTRWVTYGCQLYGTAATSGWNLILESEVTVDRIDLSCVGGDVDRGVLIRGSWVDVGVMHVTSRGTATGRNYRRRGLVIGAEGVGCSHVRLGDVRVEGFLDSVGSWSASDVTVDRLTMRGHVQGLYLRDPLRWSVGAGSADEINMGLSKGGPGENSVLIEAGDGGVSGEVSISNFHSREASEHGFRVGGQSPINGITFDNCVSSRAGAGDGTGGCGFKALGPTSIVSNARTAKHHNVRFVNCTVEPLAVVKGTGNFSAFNVGKCEGVSFVSPKVTRGADTTATTAAYGISMIGCENVSITEPSIESTMSAGIYVYDEADTSTVTWGGDPTALSISGGFIRNCGKGLEVAIGGRTFRLLTASNLSVDAGDYSVVIWSGTMNRASLDLIAKYPAVATLRGTEAVMCQVKGDLVGDSPARNGSTFTDYPTGDFLVRQGYEWKRVTV